MLIGNPSSQKILRSYLDIFFGWQKDVPSFYILSGPAHIGKSSYALDLVKEYLWWLRQSDLLHIKDFSQQLGEHHSLKIAYDRWWDRTKKLYDERGYQDLGIREINLRLQQSSLSTFKVVLIENIERIVPAAANAFLKTAEEPFPRRIIIATTSHRSQLLDTITSRALVVHFQGLSTEELLQFADTHQLFTDDNILRELACDMALGKPGMLITFHELLQNDELLRSQFTSIVKLLSERKHIFEAHTILKNFKAKGIREYFLDGWIAYCARHHLDTQAKHRLHVKKMMKSTVNDDHLMLYGLL